MTPRVSVLVPAHDDGPFLDANLRSLAEQTCSDFEAVVADDASTDDTPQIARAWAARDPRFRLDRIETNIGMNRNWNRALAAAAGELVIKLDADDAMSPRALEFLVAEFDLTPDLLYAACRTLDCDLDLQPLGPFRGDEALRLHGLDPETRHLRRGLEWLRICFDDIQPWTSDAQMYRRSDLLDLGGWETSLMVSDTDLILRALSLDRRVAHVPEFGVLYRRREDSSSHREHASGAARLELNMIALRALHAAAPRLHPWGRALRQNWWRIWRRFLDDRNAQSIWETLPAARRAALEDLQRETLRLPPPLMVRLEGTMRRRAWRARQVLRGGATSGEGR